MNEYPGKKVQTGCVRRFNLSYDVVYVVKKKRLEFTAPRTRIGACSSMYCTPRCHAVRGPAVSTAGLLLTDKFLNGTAAP